MDFFDLRTAYLVTGMLYFIMPVAVWLALKENRTGAVDAWCAGGALFGLGLLLLSLRNHLPNWITYEVAGLLMNMGHLARVTALRSELKRPFGRITRVLLLCAFMLLYELGRTFDPQGPSIYMVSLAALVIYFSWIATLAHQLARRDKLQSASWLGFTYIPLALLALLNLLRVGTGIAELGPMLFDWGTIAMVLAGSITAVIGNTCFMGIYVERATQRQLAMAAEQARTAENARLARQIAHLDRMRGMSMVTASAVHELSQPLTTIQLIAEHAQLEGKLRPDNTAAILNHVVNILRQSRHAGDVLQRIRNFINTKETSHAPVSLQAVNEQVMALLEEWLRSEGVIVELSAPDAPVMVMGDSVQLAQILVNLYRNAIEATAGQVHRRIQVHIQEKDQRARIQVSDNGPGFSTEALPQDKDFFSTKSDGLGVGLLISRQIAKQHQGQLNIRNETSGGAVVELDLPVYPLG